MEAVKCPSCGSGACKKIDAEHYICLACDNEFLVHNLSKEFKATDEHIDRVREDIKNDIESLKNSDIDSLDSLTKRAQQFLDFGDISTAEGIYNEICQKYPSSYNGWWGLFLVDSNNLNEYDIESLSLDADELLRRVYVCEDVPEDIINRSKEYYNKVLKQCEEKNNIFLDSAHNKISEIDDAIELNNKLLGENNEKSKELQSKISESKKSFDLFKKGMQSFEKKHDIGFWICNIIVFVLLIFIVKIFGGWVIDSVKYNYDFGKYETSFFSRIITFVWQVIILVLQSAFAIALSIGAGTITFMIVNTVYMLLTDRSSLKWKNNVELSENEVNEISDNIKKVNIDIDNINIQLDELNQQKMDINSIISKNRDILKKCQADDNIQLKILQEMYFDFSPKDQPSDQQPTLFEDMINELVDSMN